MARRRGILDRLRSRGDDEPSEPTEGLGLEPGDRALAADAEPQDPGPADERPEDWAPAEQQGDASPGERANPATGEWAPPADPDTDAEADAGPEDPQPAQAPTGDAEETTREAREELLERLERAEADAAEAAERAERHARERDEADRRAQRAIAAAQQREDDAAPIAEAETGVPRPEPGSAEERIAEIIAEREADLQREREEKVRAIEAADRRLEELEERAEQAGERLAAAEEALAAEAERLAAEAAAKLERATIEAREQARIEADQGIAEREAKLERAARDATEARSAAAEWLRSQATALRQEGERAGRSELERAVATARKSGAAEAERRLRAEIERVRARSDALDNGDRTQSREQRFRAAAERLGGARPTGSARPTADTDSDRGKARARVSLAEVSFEQLRGTGLSVREAKRVLRYRDERGLSGVAALAEVPGLSAEAVDELKSRLTD
jgi:hypothetical protein